MASIGTVLDAAALLLSASDFSTEQHPAEEIKGPMMALAYGMPTVVKIGIAASLPIAPPVKLNDLMAASAQAPPEVSIRREEYFAALDRLHPLLPVPPEQREACWRRFAWIRSGYDHALRGLAGLTLAAAAPWTTDRPAHTARPRLLLRHPIEVVWTVQGPD